MLCNWVVFILQKKGIFKRPRGNKRGCIEFTTPEIKLLLVFLYFTFATCVNWADFSTQLRNRNGLFTAIFDYVSCVNKQGGDCEELRDDIYAISFPVLSVCAILLTSLVSVSNVVFVLQFRDVRKRLRTLTKRFTSRSEIDGGNYNNYNKSNIMDQKEETEM